MKVRFLQDYQGRWTGVHFYRKDQVVDLDDAVADALIGDKRAVEVVAAPVAPPLTPKPQPTPKPKHERGTGVL